MFGTLPQPVDNVLCFSKVDLIQRASDFVFHVLGREVSQWSQQTGLEAHTHLPQSTLQSLSWPQGGAVGLLPCAESQCQAAGSPPIICVVGLFYP